MSNTPPPETLQVVCTRIGHHTEGLQLLSFSEFSQQFPSHKIELITDEGSKITHWRHRNGPYRWTKIKIGREFRRFEKDGPIAVIDLEDVEAIRLFGILDKFYKSNNHVNTPIA